ncbi:MAG TPA: T9SS type A sorting domain-containing protein [Lacibacter sp.]|nr:T9SS type A sorting domain-containing protein [Lacibacter sp.]
MTKKLLSLLVLLTTLSNIYAQQAEVIGSLFYNNATNVITIRLGIHNKTGSGQDMGYAAQRWGIQYNSSAVTYQGFFSYAYLWGNQATGLNDPNTQALIGPDTGTGAGDIGMESPSSRTAYLQTDSSVTKTYQMRYINRSTNQCLSTFLIPEDETRIVMDIYFTLNDPNLASYYHLNDPDYGFDSNEFIAQFFTKNTGGHNSKFKSHKTEIAITVIRQGNLTTGSNSNPYQPFSMGSCVSGSVNVITVGGEDIFFQDPEEGILASKLKNAFVKERSGFAEINWGVENNQTVDHFEVERMEPGGNFKTIGLVMSDNDASTKDYKFKEKLSGSETELRYRVKAFSNDGVVSYSNILKLNLKQVEVTEIRIVPNPVASFAQLNLPVINGSYLVRVYNVDGRMILTTQVQGRSQSMNVAQLSPGNYFMEAFHPQTGKRFYGKFSKQ